MIKDDIRHPERLGNADSIVSGKYGHAAFGIRKVETMGGDSEIRLTVSKDAGEDFHDSSVKAMLITPEKAHALGKALIELSGLEEEPTEDKPLHISLEEFRELWEGDKVILRDDTTSDAIFKFGYISRFQHSIQNETPVTVKQIDDQDNSVRLVNSDGLGGWFSYRAIKEVIKAPKEHFRVRLSTKIWYAGKGGQITLDKGYAAIMNKPHAENVVKKYGGQLIKVDYSELEEK